MTSFAFFALFLFEFFFEKGVLLYIQWNWVLWWLILLLFWSNLHIFKLQFKGQFWKMIHGLTFYTPNHTVIPHYWIDVYGSWKFDACLLIQFWNLFRGLVENISLILHSLSNFALQFEDCRFINRQNLLKNPFQIDFF